MSPKIIVLSLTLASGCGGAAASPTVRSDVDTRVEAELARFRALVHAPELVARAEAGGAEIGFGATEHGDLVVARFEGGGDTDAWPSDTYVLTRDGHIEAALHEAYNGEFLGPAALSPASPPEAALALLDMRGHFVRAPDDPALPLARLFASRVDAPRSREVGGARVIGPLYAAQPPTSSVGRACELEDHVAASPSHAPPLVANVRTLFVDRSLLEPHGTGLSRVGPFAPCNDEQELGELTVFLRALVDDVSGYAVALRDEGGIVRWVFETHDAVRGSALRWLGAHDGFLFAEHRCTRCLPEMEIAPGIVAVRTSDGATFRIEVEGHLEATAELTPSLLRVQTPGGWVELPIADIADATR